MNSKYIKPLIELAKHFKTFEDFQFYYCCKNFHGLYWHLTTNPNFKINPKQSPTDLSSLSSTQNKELGLMVTTDISGWYDTFHATRKYVALIDLSSASPNVDYKTTTRGFGHEIYISHPEKARVLKILPIKEAKQLQNKIYKSILPDSIEKLKQIFDHAYLSKSNISESLYLNENRTHGKSLKDEGYQWKYVIVFRAMLASEGKNIKQNDYVATSKKFAIEHANHMTSVHSELYNVVAYTVLAEKVFKAIDPGEYFYDGPVPKRADIIYKATEYL